MLNNKKATLTAMLLLSLGISAKTPKNTSATDSIRSRNEMLEYAEQLRNPDNWIVIDSVHCDSDTIRKKMRREPVIFEPQDTIFSSQNITFDEFRSQMQSKFELYKRQKQLEYEMYKQKILLQKQM